jgi:hypothetical protein
VESKKFCKFGAVGRVFNHTKFDVLAEAVPESLVLLVAFILLIIFLFVVLALFFTLLVFFLFFEIGISFLIVIFVVVILVFVFLLSKLADHLDRLADEFLGHDFEHLELLQLLTRYVERQVI